MARNVLIKRDVGQSQADGGVQDRRHSRPHPSPSAQYAVAGPAEEPGGHNVDGCRVASVTPMRRAARTGHRRNELTLDWHDIVIDLLNRVTDTGTGVDGVERFEPQRHDRGGITGVVLLKAPRTSVILLVVNAKLCSGLTHRM